jgi:Flp pilus assembly protein TadG
MSALRCLPRSRPSRRANSSAQRGAAAVLLLLLLTALVGLAAYNSDATRMTADASQLKRATDAAALAAAASYAQDDSSDLQQIAERYVNANLGMDAEQTSRELRITVEPFTSNGDPAVRVRASFSAQALLKAAGPREVSVASTAVARSKSLEVALALPNTLNENSAELAVLRSLGKDFAERLIGERSNTFLALVPYSQSVNVYDAQQTDRIRNWASSGALNPVELTSLFRSGYGSLADRRIPDRRANLLCMYRGLNRGENYFWDQAPSGQFKIYYRHDLPSNDLVYGIEPYEISWTGPNPDFGQATGVNDTRYMIADRGCPHAPLLPLSNDLDAIDARLDQMSSRFNTNYAIALGWSAMALAPAFRGGDGWGLDDELPHDFDNSQDHIKAIVFVVKSTGQRWFDSDNYNSYVGQKIDGDNDSGSTNDSLITERFRNLCTSLRARDIKFYLIVTGSDEAEDENGNITSASHFRQVAGPGLNVCAEKNTDQTYLSGTEFVDSEGEIEDRLQEIADDLHVLSNDLRLIE